MVRRGAVDRKGLASGGELKSQATTVFLVGDDRGVVRDLSRSVRAAGHNVRWFLSSRDFLAEHDLTTPGCAVLGFTMPGLSSLELQNALATSGNQRPIIFMSRNADIASGVQAMKRGAVDFLTKPVKERALLAAVEHAIERDRQMREIWAELRSIGSRLAMLTARELEVFNHVASGHRNKQIAHDLGTVEKTIKVHRSSVMKKMGARSLPHLIRMAIQMERAG
jgi:FixJ family two-component response regulator